MKQQWLMVGISLLIFGGCSKFSEKGNPTPIPTNTTTLKNIEPTNSTNSAVNIPTSNSTEKWAGPWTNSLGEQGNDTLVITDDGNGNVTGIWSDTINVTGKWLDKNTIKFSGRTATRDYQAQGTIQNNLLILHYVATRLNTSGSYTGDEKLTQVLN